MSCDKIESCIQILCSSTENKWTESRKNALLELDKILSSEHLEKQRAREIFEQVKPVLLSIINTEVNKLDLCKTACHIVQQFVDLVGKKGFKKDSVHFLKPLLKLHSNHYAIVRSASQDCVKHILSSPWRISKKCYPLFTAFGALCKIEEAGTKITALEYIKIICQHNSTAFLQERVLSIIKMFKEVDDFKTNERIQKLVEEILQIIQKQRETMDHHEDLETQDSDELSTSVRSSREITEKIMDEVFDAIENVNKDTIEVHNLSTTDSETKPEQKSLAVDQETDSVITSTNTSIIDNKNDKEPPNLENDENAVNEETNIDTQTMISHHQNTRGHLKDEGKTENLDDFKTTVVQHTTVPDENESTSKETEKKIDEKEDDTQKKGMKSGEESKMHSPTTSKIKTEPQDETNLQCEKEDTFDAEMKETEISRSKIVYEIPPSPILSKPYTVDDSQKEDDVEELLMEDIPDPELSDDKDLSKHSSPIKSTASSPSSRKSSIVSPSLKLSNSKTGTVVYISSSSPVKNASPTDKPLTPKRLSFDQKEPLNISINIQRPVNSAPIQEMNITFNETSDNLDVIDPIKKIELVSNHLETFEITEEETFHKRRNSNSSIHSTPTTTSSATLTSPMDISDLLEKARREGMQQTEAEIRIIQQSMDELERKYNKEVRERKLLQSALQQYEKALQAFYINGESRNDSEIAKKYNQLKEDYTKLENTFKLLQKRYKEVKTINEKYKENEGIFKAKLEESFKNVQKCEQKFANLKAHAEKTLDGANKQIKKMQAEAKEKDEIIKVLNKQNEQLKREIKTLKMKMESMKTSQQKQRHKLHMKQDEKQQLETVRKSASLRRRDTPRVDASQFEKLKTEVEELKKSLVQQKEKYDELQSKLTQKEMENKELLEICDRLLTQNGIV